MKQIRQFYRNRINELYTILEKVQIIKILVFEWIDINHAYNRKLVKSVKFTKMQKKEIQQYWKKNYGRKIPLHWHRLYQAFSGTFCVEYFPEILFTAKLERILNPYFNAKVLADKGLLDCLFEDSLVKKPQTIVLRNKGYYFDKNYILINKNQAIKIAKEYNKIVYKPIRGSSSGEGVMVLHIENDYVTEAGVSIEQFLEMNEDFICQFPIEQCDEFARLHKESVNTIRVITYIAKDTIYHMGLIMRIGVGKNVVDNVHAGGLFIGVEDDGTLHKEAYLQNRTRYLAHPDSGIIFESYKLPGISLLLKTAKELHGRVSQCEMISWDFTIDKDGDPVLIEINLRAQSIHYPQKCHGKGAFKENTKFMINMIRK